MLKLLLVSENIKALAVQKLMETPAGENYEFTIKKKHSKRSLEQNSYYWRTLHEISEHGKYNSEIYHEYFRRKFLGGDVAVIDGDEYFQPRSTTTLDIEEMANYITKIEAWAAGHGIFLDGGDQAGRC